MYPQSKIRDFRKLPSRRRPETEIPSDILLASVNPPIAATPSVTQVRKSLAVMSVNIEVATVPAIYRSHAEGAENQPSQLHPPGTKVFFESETGSCCPSLCLTSYQVAFGVSIYISISIYCTCSLCNFNP